MVMKVTVVEGEISTTVGISHEAAEFALRLFCLSKQALLAVKRVCVLAHFQQNARITESP